MAMADEEAKSNNVPNELTLDDSWRDIGATLGTNGLIGASVGFLVSLVLMRKRRSVMIGFGSGIGVGIGWRDSHATSQFMQFSNSNILNSNKTLPSLKDRFYEMTSNLTNTTKESKE